MSKIATGLIEFCKGKIGTPYVYGAIGEILTPAVLDRLAKESPGMFTSTYKAKAKKYIGQRCVDCSGLISWYTGIQRGSYNFHDTATERVSIDHLSESMIGWALWKPGHIGVYIGGGYCIEAKGIDYGTIKSPVTATPWQKVLKLRDIDYTASVALEPSKKSGWIKDGNGWWYRKPDGSYPANKWCVINHHWYLFNGNGYACTGWHRWNGSICDPVDESGDWYYFDPTNGGPYEGACWHSQDNGAMEVWYVDQADSV